MSSTAPGRRGGAGKEGDVVVFRSATIDSKGGWKAEIQSRCILFWAIFCHAILTAWPYCGVGLIVLSLFYPPAVYVVVFFLSTVLLPRAPHLQFIIDGLDILVFEWWRRYISYKVSYSKKLDVSQQIIFAEFPHGAFPAAGQMHAAVCPKIHTRQLKVLAADVLFKIPLWRHYMSVGGCVPASGANFTKALDGGFCVSIQVGGIAEMYVGEKDKEVIVLSRRRGFVVRAVERGVPIAPCFHFGNSKLLDFGPKWLAKWGRRWRVSLGFIWGRWWLPIPRQVPVWTVAGAPIDTGKGMSRDDPAFSDKVEQVHAQVMQAVRDLYESHRAEYFDGHESWKDRPLVIL